jgi:PmbA protein
LVLVRFRIASVPVVFEYGAMKNLSIVFLKWSVAAPSFDEHHFLLGRLDEFVASTLLTVIDDGRRPGALGTRPDSEGLPTRKTVVIDKRKAPTPYRVTYTARKLNLNSTGNASRGLTGSTRLAL